MTKRERILLGITGKEYKDINAIAAEMKPMPTPCELAAENDRLMQKVSALCKERDEAHRQIDRLVIRLNDETEKAARLEAENRAKEQYIAETIGKVIKERDAAIEDLSKICYTNLHRLRANACFYCKKWSICDKITTKDCKRFEWRGVQEREER